MSKKVKVNQNILEMQYAVRGPIPQRALKLRQAGRKTIPCNIGNPQALGQPPISFYRHILGLLEDPSRIKSERKIKQLYKSNPELLENFTESDIISDYILEFTEKILSNLDSAIGAYSEGNGFKFVREAIAEFIDRRDNATESGIYANPDTIFLVNGAGEGAKYIIDLLISDPRDGIMIPIPQYPLYSASIRKCNGVQVNYYPNEDNGWTINSSILEDPYNDALKNGVKVKAIVVINPGNPTGAILDLESIETLLDFAEERELSIIADEVYQENLYGEKFISFAKAIKNRNIPLFSLHSTSKGFIGECGHRGGYLEARNAPVAEGTNIPLTDLILKQASVNLCSNTVGQILTYLMVSPPDKNSKDYQLYLKEKNTILNELCEKSKMIKEAFKQMDGVECFGKTGAMYLFPRLNKLPAESTDFDYCMSLLEETGICTVNGSGFGQKEGTSHLRIAFLPPKKLLEKVLPEWIEFHNKYVTLGS